MATTAIAAESVRAAPDRRHAIARAGLVWTLVRTDFKARYHGTLGGFVWAERRSTDPLLPFILFSEPTFTAASLAGFFSCAAMFGALVHVPLLGQWGHGTSATTAAPLSASHEDMTMASSASSRPQTGYVLRRFRQLLPVRVERARGRPLPPARWRSLRAYR